MPPLASNLRGQLERAVSDARNVAEAAAAAAMTAIGVEVESRPGHLDEATNRVRLALRARARALGKGNQKGGMPALVEEVAYEQWHRMLFARFLAENDLLIDPASKQSVTLEICAELAQEEGIDDPWVLAASFASEMLPGIFRVDDPAVQVRLASEGRTKLEAILAALPPDVFTADDALGWVYQFWQAKKKDEVNKSGRKIGGEDIAPVTQLFTEHYMVRFLLENSLGAWWAARHPGSPLLKEWEYLRFRDDGTPAAGTFPGWPEHAREVTVMDPCCGSGHFLVAAADMLRNMRMEEEGLNSAAAAEAVLRDNLYGLELDPRCTQIAAFALAFDAWRSERKYWPLPAPNLACSGVAVGGSAEEWMDLAGDNGRLRYTLEQLFDLFKDAPDLGSLINPAQLAVKDRLFTADYDEVAPLVKAALTAQGNDPAAAVFGAAAKDAANAGDLLAKRYHFVTTNPPYLGRGSQTDTLKNYADRAHPEGKADLATMFVERSRAFTAGGGAYALVIPQNGLFLSSYKKLRERLLKEQTWSHLSWLGEGGFESASAAGAFVALVILEQRSPTRGHLISGINAIPQKSGRDKAIELRSGDLVLVEQAAQLTNPLSVISLQAFGSAPPLKDVANVFEGLHTGDYPRFGRQFWELAEIAGGWARQQSASHGEAPFSGRDLALYWEDGAGQLVQFVRERLASDVVSRWIKGAGAWHKRGVAVSKMRDLRATMYGGEVYTHGAYAVIPKREADLPALWLFLNSSEFREAARTLDRQVAIARSALEDVPLDVARWRREAEQLYPDGLPEPHSDDPTQWLFNGNIVGSEAPLQVAVARLLGYRWPDQEADSLDAFTDDDGIVCLPPVQGEQPAAERLRALLAAAHGNPPTGPRPKGAPPWPKLPPTAHEWIEQLLASVGYGAKSLEEWLRDSFFEQHCNLFKGSQPRPFIWHVDDGLKGKGFSALVNYHKLGGAKLQRLIYSYLQPYIDTTKAQVDAGEAGSEGRLKAATDLKAKLEAIRLGEPPYDIYARWKKLHEQPIGWDPDLDDGVRLNIRPWITAGVLRKNPKIKWSVDRGTNPDGTKRDNDAHRTRAEKEAARRAAGVSP